MKEHLAILVGLCLGLLACSNMSAQPQPMTATPTVPQSATTNDILRDSLYNILERCHAIKTLSEIDAMPKRQQAIYLRLRDHFASKYEYPQAPLIYAYDSARDYNGPTVVRLGGYIIRGNVNISPAAFPPSSNPDIRWQSAAQVFLKDPSSSYYNLFIDCGYLVNQLLSADAQLTAFIDASARAALSDAYSNHRSISIGVGLFRNELADVFDRVSRNRAAPSDFLPLLDVYDLYSNNDPAKRIDADSRIVGSFFGMVIRENAQQRTSAGMRVEEAVKVSTGLAFLKVNGDQNALWTRDESSMSDAGYFRILVAPGGSSWKRSPAKRRSRRFGCSSQHFQ
ncbi:MAG: hypothetical protein JO231_07180 [Acidobacteria bacterium]|nr:hypothetical protein [Acidobacteriota bacterium]